MPNIRAIAAALTVLVFAAAAHATGYNLRGPSQKVGETIRIETVTKMNDGTMDITASMISLTGKTDMTVRSTLETTILEMEDDKVTKVRARFVAESQTQMVEMMGQRNQTTTNGPLQGKSIIGTYKDGTWTFELEEGTPTPEQRVRLREIATEYRFLDRAATVYPDREIKIGESWEVDAADLPTSFGRSQRSNGKMTYTLDKVEEVDGEKLAFITVVIDVSATVTGEADGTVTMKAEGPLVRSLTRFVDKSSELTGTMEMRMAQGEDAQVRMRGPLTVTTSESRP